VAGGTTAPLGIDTTVPTTARMYDYWLGGHDNFAVDRAAALAVSEAAPEMKMMALENRKFLRRAVRYLAAEAGIVQFLDIGTGLPTQGNVHQVAQQVTPDARVVYADNDRCKSGCAHTRWADWEVGVDGSGRAGCGIGTRWLMRNSL
jgi:S-adenosyl methyltransferase